MNHRLRGTGHLTLSEMCNLMAESAQCPKAFAIPVDVQEVGHFELRLPSRYYGECPLLYASENMLKCYVNFQPKPYMKSFSLNTRRALKQNPEDAGS